MTNTLRSAQLRRSGGFLRTAELNWVGWSALAVGSCAVGAGCAALASLVDWPQLPAAAVGVFVVPLLLIALDRRTWRAGYTYTGMSGDADELAQTAVRLRGLGFDVTLDAATQDEPSLLVRNRDLAQVQGRLR